jgi:ABC-2 type transport system permease protein
MSALLAAEALKLRTTRLSWIVAGIAAILSGLIGYAVVKIAADQGEPVSLSAVAAAPAQAMWFLGIVVALVASAGEFQHRTIRTTLLASPRRIPVLIAKSVVAAAYGALLVVLGGTIAAVAAWVTSTLLHESLGGSSVVSWPHVLGTVVVGALWPILATGLGILTRSIAVAVGVVLLWRFVGEGVLPVVTGVDGISRWLPMGLAQSIVEGTAPLGAGVVLAGYVAAISGLGAVVFLRRDPT